MLPPYLFGNTSGTLPANVGPSTLMNNHLLHETLFQPYRRAAIDLLLDHDFELPPSDSLSLIVESAVAVCQLFLVSATRHPDSAEIRQVFNAFVLSCVTVPVQEVLQ